MTETEIDDKELAILEYIKNNPGVNKEEVKKWASKQGIYSYVTTQKVLDSFITSKIVNARKDKPNSQFYRLYIDQEDEILAIYQNLINFSKLYFPFLQEIICIYNEQHSRSSNPKGKEESTTLLIVAIWNFDFAIDSVIFQIRFVWSKNYEDKKMLLDLYSKMFAKIVDMQKMFLEYFAQIYPTQNELILTNESRTHLLDILGLIRNQLHICYKYGISDSQNNIIKILSEILKSKEK